MVVHLLHIKSVRSDPSPPCHLPPATCLPSLPSLPRLPALSRTQSPLRHRSVSSVKPTIHTTCLPLDPLILPLLTPSTNGREIDQFVRQSVSLMSELRH